MRVHKFDIILPPQDISCAPGLQGQLAAGKAEAFAWVYKNYCRRIYNYVLLITGDETTSEDIVQEVFIKVWRYKEKLAGIENFNAYLYKLAKNCTIDTLQGKKKRERLYELYGTELRVSANAADELLFFNETSRLIKAAIEYLPQKQRIIFELRDQDMKRPAIAKLLQQSEFAIKGHINRGLKFIKSKMGQ